jgi:hypothetical protein
MMDRMPFMAKNNLPEELKMRGRVSCRRYHALSAVIAAFIFCTLCWANPASTATPFEARKEIKQMGIEYTEQQFATSAGAGDMTAVKLFLNAGMDVNAGGGSALGLAAGRGQIEMVKFLLSEGAKPTSNSLQFARTRGHKEIEKILVEAGAKE